MAEQGVVEFALAPKDVRNITVKIMDENGKVLSQAYPEGPSFKMTYAAGTYAVLIDAQNAARQMTRPTTSNCTLLRLAMPLIPMMSSFDS